MKNIYVDGACSGNSASNGIAEYRIVGDDKVTEIYRSRKFRGTNNIAEYLALCHAILLMNRDFPNEKFTIWSDSVTAIAWLRDEPKSAMTLNDDTAWTINQVWKAHKSIKNSHNMNCRVEKWDTKTRGEIPADFGNKKGKKK